MFYALRLTIAFLLCSLLGVSFGITGQPKVVPLSDDSYEQLTEDADKVYAEGSYWKAHVLYEQAKRLAPDPAAARLMDLKISDSSWRNEVASQSRDDSKLQAALTTLRELAKSDRPGHQRDVVWADANASLGDYFWIRNRDWGSGWRHYELALDFWAGSSDAELARGRYLSISQRLLLPSWLDLSNRWIHGWVQAPASVARNAASLSDTPDDIARANLALALILRKTSPNWHAIKQIPETFERVIEMGIGSKTLRETYQAALFHYAEFLSQDGRAVTLSNGQQVRRADYAAALELYRRIVKEFTAQDSSFWGASRDRIREITKAELDVSVGQTFLPGSEIQFNLGWRNIEEIEFRLFRTNLTTDVDLGSRTPDYKGWLESLKLDDLDRLKSWRRLASEEDDYEFHRESLHLDEPLARGAYIIEARSGSHTSRDVILVTELSIVVKRSYDQVLVYATNALTGAPARDATVRVWVSDRFDRRIGPDEWRGTQQEAKTDIDGLCIFDIPSERQRRRLFVAARHQDDQTFATDGWGDYRNRSGDYTWRIYATTDRPAYRPGDTVRWKATARTFNGSIHETPDSEVLQYEIHGPRGKIKDGSVELNSFGSAWDEFSLDETMALGSYSINFKSARDKDRHLGGVELFRLEEYKLPEFEVTIQTPRDENDRPRIYRSGETIEVEIDAQYYFGGPVGDATAEIVVYQKPFHHRWTPTRRYPWLYEHLDQSRRWGWWGPGNAIKRETIKTDATGKATLTFDAPQDGSEDNEFTIEARVVDSSRREVTTKGTVRVTRQRFYVYADPDRLLYAPNEPVEIKFHALDANDEPVETDGKIVVTREKWVEIWIDPDGKEHRFDGGEVPLPLRTPLPPVADARGPQWRLKYRGYEREDVLVSNAMTDAEGHALWSFTPSKEGYYRVAWLSFDRDGAPIRTETTIWVATNATDKLGYRQDGVQIIIDKETMQANTSVPVMLSTPTNGRYVLFSVEGASLYDYRVVHVPGNVRLIHVPLDARHIPNVQFHASMVYDGQHHRDTEEVILPPDEHYLELEVKYDREAYEPRESGTIEVFARDHDGNPVEAEISLTSVDESVYYIQPDLAGDPRPYFFNQRQNHAVATRNSMSRPFSKWVRVGDREFIDMRLAAGDAIETYSIPAEDEQALGLASNTAWTEGAPGEDAMMAMDAAPNAAPASASFRGRSSGGAVRESLRQEVAGEAGDFAPSRKMAALDDDARDPDAPDAPDVVVRTDFRATALWVPDLKTDASGRAVADITWPDTLTRWKAVARAFTTGNQAGMGEATARTRQPLIVRLQAPRFFVVGDEVIISAVMNNNTEEAMTVTPELAAEGVTVVGVFTDEGTSNGGSPIVRVEPNGQTRINWKLRITEAGVANLQVSARSASHSDAMAKSYPIHEHGIEKFLARSGKIRDRDVSMTFDLPSRREDSTSLAIQVTPSIAVTMLDALPYLIDYPYGCTEQTMSRFMPAAITLKTLSDLGLEPEDVADRLFGGINPEHVDKTHKKDSKGLAELEAVTKASLERLYEFQHGDGGWGWWKDGDSDPFMSAYVTWGLCLAADADVEIDHAVIRSAMNYLDSKILDARGQFDRQAWILHGLTAAQNTLDAQPGPESPAHRAFDNLFERREQLNAYTRALLTMSAHRLGKTDPTRILLDNLANGVKIDETPDTSVIVNGGGQDHHAGTMATAHWGEDGIYWRWSDGGVEATAFTLMALMEVRPDDELVEPVMNWLVKNRRGAHWSNTRDTAIVVLAMNAYLQKSGELNANSSYEVFVNGNSVGQADITPQTVIGAPSVYNIDPELLRTGPNEVRIVRGEDDNGALYYAAHAKFFSLEEPVTAAGNEIFVRRDYYKLTPRRTLLKGFVYDRVPLRDGDDVVSGERVEVVVTIEAKNNYEYLLFEDLKPAGLEAVQVRSGESMFARELKSSGVERRFIEGDDEAISRSMATNQADVVGESYTGARRWIHQELRDRKVALFMDRLDQGVWEIRYDLRAESPGKFHALPVLGHAMYIPEIRCNGREIRIEVLDATN